MDEKKFQRALDAILEAQAQFYVDLQHVQETNKEIQELQKGAEKRVSVLERACVNLYNMTVKHDELIEGQSNNIDKVTADIAELREAQKETGERLNAVIFMAEKFFGGNGKSKK